MSEVLVDDLRDRGVDVSKDDMHISVAAVGKTLEWLFGDGNVILLDYLERHLNLMKN